MKYIYQSYYTKSITNDKTLIYIYKINSKKKVFMFVCRLFFHIIINLIDRFQNAVENFTQKKVYAPFYPLTIFV